METLGHVLTVFASSGITPPGLDDISIMHHQYIVGGWPTDFGRDPRSSETGRTRRSFVFFVMIKEKHNFIDIPLAKFHEI